MEVKWLFNVDLYTPTSRSDCELSEKYTNTPIAITLILDARIKEK